MTNQLAGDARFELTGHLLHEAIDEEVIVIDLTTGTYYSMRGSAAELWELIKRTPGISKQELEDAVVNRYESNGVDVDGALTAFLGQLLDEGLLNPVDRAVASPVVERAGDTNGTSGGTFVAPVLEKYTDMQDLVLIDPVHDVSSAGWPHTRPDLPADGVAA